MEYNNNPQQPNTITAPPAMPTMPSMPVLQEIQKPVNPLLARIHMPGSTFTLPSGGIFYKKGELDPSVENGEVHVHPMTAYDEVLLKTPDLLFSGEAVVKVFNRCIPQILKPMELFGKDVDFLMICLRKLTYGDKFQMTYTHDCDDAKEHEYTVDINVFINETKQIDPTTIGKIYKNTMENGQIVNMHPPRFRDIIKMMQNYDPSNVKSPEDETTEIIQTVMSVISSVDDVTDKGHITEWLSTLSAGDVRKLSNAIEETTEWGPDFIYHTKCKDCNGNLDITAPINPLAFFI